MKSRYVEPAVLLLAFGIILVVGFAGLLENNVQHSVASGPFLASDAYQNLRLAQEVYINGDYKNLKVYPEFPEVAGSYSPGLFMLPAMLSSLTGIEVHDAVSITLTFTLILTMFAAYLLIRTFKKNVALASLPIMAYMVVSPFNISFVWGQWAMTTGVLLLFVSLWALKRIDEQWMPVWLGIAAGALAITHQSELIMFAMITALVAIVFFIQHKLSKPSFTFGKQLVIAGIIGMILFAYYLPIFVVSQNFGGTESTNNIFDLSKIQTSDHFPERTLSTMGFYLIPVLIGIIVFLLLKNKEKLRPEVIMLTFLSIIPYLNYLGGAFALRALLLRFFWPIVLAFFFGLGLYFILEKVKLKKYIIPITIILLIFPLTAQGNLNQLGNNKIIDDELMKGYDWIAQNTPEQSRVLNFPIGSRPHTVLQNFRQNFYLSGNIYNQAVAGQNNLSNISTIIHKILNMPYYKAFLHVESFVEEKDLYIYEICEVDYLVFPLAGIPQQWFDFNRGIIEQRIENNLSQPVYQDNRVLILQNLETCKRQFSEK